MTILDVFDVFNEHNNGIVCHILHNKFLHEIFKLTTNDNLHTKDGPPHCHLSMVHKKIMFYYYLGRLIFLWQNGITEKFKGQKILLRGFDGVAGRSEKYNSGTKVF